MRVQTADYQTSDWHGAWRRIFPHTAGYIEVGDFSIPLRCARNDIGEFGGLLSAFRGEESDCQTSDVRRQTGMVIGNVSSVYGWSHGEGRFRGSASDPRNDRERGFQNEND